MPNFITMSINENLLECILTVMMHFQAGLVVYQSKASITVYLQLIKCITFQLVSARNTCPLQTS